MSLFGLRSSRHYVQQPAYFEWTITLPQTEDQEDIRRIVREELADIMPIDVPDAPPEDL